MKALLFLLAIFCTTILHGQERIKTYVIENAVPMSSFESASPAQLDLEALGKSIGNATIVMLGEQDHGDAATFLAKAKIVEYLHKHKGFEVLAFETGFFAPNHYDLQNFTSKQSIDSFIDKAAGHFWSQCDASKDLLFRYLPSTQQTTNPLHLSGFDITIGTKDFFNHFKNYINEKNLPINADGNFSSEIFPLLMNWFGSKEDTLLINRTNDYLVEIKNQLLQVTHEGDVWLLLIDNLIVENNLYKYRGIKGFYYLSHNLRDKQMAANLKWLIKYKYPDKKIIVWAHNYHISKNNGNYDEDFLNNAETMGGLLTKDSLDRAKTYILGFTSLQGRTGRILETPYSFSRPDKNSLERWINDSLKFAFVDFKKYNSRGAPIESFNMSGAVKGTIFYHKSHKSYWTKIFDGVFYIRDMYPCQN